MVGKTETALGEIIISDDTLAKMAGYVATNCYGVVGMVYRNKKDGIASLLKRDKMAKGIKVTKEGDAIVISLHIMVEYGVNITAVSESIIKNVKYHINKCTGLDINDVRVNIESVRI